MAGAMAGAGFGMGLDHNGPAGVIVSGLCQHVGKAVGAGPAQRDRGIAARLVDHEDVIARGWIKPWVGRGVFGQMRGGDAGHDSARPVQKRRVVERVGRQQDFQIGWRPGVEMDPAPVDDQTKRRPTRSAGVQPAQECVFDPDQMRAAALGNRGAPRGMGRMAPDQHVIPAPRPAQPQIMARQRQDAPHPALRQKSRGKDMAPLALRSRRGIVWRAHFGVTGQRC